MNGVASHIVKQKNITFYLMPYEIAAETSLQFLIIKPTVVNQGTRRRVMARVENQILSGKIVTHSDLITAMRGEVDVRCIKKSWYLSGIVKVVQ